MWKWWIILRKQSFESKATLLCSSIFPVFIPGTFGVNLVLPVKSERLINKKSEAEPTNSLWNFPKPGLRQLCSSRPELEEHKASSFCDLISFYVTISKPNPPCNPGDFFLPQLSFQSSLPPSFLQCVHGCWDNQNTVLQLGKALGDQQPTTNCGTLEVSPSVSASCCAWAQQPALTPSWGITEISKSRLGSLGSSCSWLSNTSRKNTPSFSARGLLWLLGWNRLGSRHGEGKQETERFAW